MHRQDILNYLNRHQTRFIEEAGFIRRAKMFISSHDEIFYRHQFPAHVTGSAWVVNPSRTHALMMHHKKLDRWFQPGGHADGDNDILRVAIKETSEETGVDEGHIKLVSTQVFDLDIHSIPANQVDPWHEHIDLRFLLEIDDRVDIPGNDESHQVLWVPLNEIKRYNNSQSTRRMVEKTRHLSR